LATPEEALVASKDRVLALSDAYAVPHPSYANSLLAAATATAESLFPAAHSNVVIPSEVMFPFASNAKLFPAVPLAENQGDAPVRKGTASGLSIRIPAVHERILRLALYDPCNESCIEAGHLQTSKVGAALESTVRGIERQLRRRGLLGINEDGAGPDVPGDPESNLAASAVSGQTPPAGPQWVSGLQPLEPLLR
jgi:hypothetical protein